MSIGDLMSLGYAWEKFHAAVLILAGSHSSVQERLYSAYTYQLMHIKLEQVPEELRDEFSVLIKEMKQVKRPEQQLSVASATKAIGIEKATELAENLVSMYDRIAQIYGAAKQK
jgi:uncharacterized protein YktB (UPF0637 family)